MAVGVFGHSLEARLEPLELSAQLRGALLAQAPRLAEARVPDAVQGALRSELQRSLDDAFVSSFRAAMLVAAALALAGAWCAARTIDPRRSRATSQGRGPDRA